jgi:hypothetical protein
MTGNLVRLANSPPVLKITHAVDKANYNFCPDGVGERVPPGVINKSKGNR